MEKDSPYTGPERRRRKRSNRFIAKYDQRQREQHNVLVRPFRITAGVALILGGVAIGWLPGPGFVILALPGAFLLASEIRRAALIMDRIENVTIPRLKRLHARLRGGPKPEWVEQDPQLWADWCKATGKQLHEEPETELAATARANTVSSSTADATAPVVEAEADAATR